MSRPIHVIATEIALDWKKPYFGAAPYLEAMCSLSTINDKYGLDDAKEILIYFLANATTWRGDVARRIKLEIKDLIAGK